MRRPARNRGEAEERWRHFIQQAVACVSSTAQVFVGPTPLGRDDDFVSLACYEGPIELRTGGSGLLALQIAQRGRVILDERAEHRGDYRITTLAYFYEIISDGEALIRWHWDPETHPEPHLHVPIDDPRGRSMRLHVPTGPRRTSVEQVVRFLITEWGVQPMRKDWDAQLSETQARFDRYRMQDRNT